MRNFETEVSALAEKIGPPEAAVQPETLVIASKGLQVTDRRYGPRSSRPLRYHNADHDLDSTGRAILLGNMLFEFVPEEYRELFFDKIMVVKAWHDAERMKGPGANEEASADMMIEEVERNGGPVLNTDLFKTATFLGVMGTQMRIEEDSFTHLNLRRGMPDPSILLEAWADIGAIPMEGKKRLWRDSINLANDEQPDPTATQILDSLFKQASFIKSVVSDDVVMPQIEYYFRDNPEEVYNLLRAVFHGNIISAYNLALMIHENPLLERAAVRTAHGLDRARVGTFAGKAISRAVRS